MASGSSPAASQVAPDAIAVRQHLELLAAPAVGGSLSDGLIELGYGPGKAKDAHLFPLTDLHQMVEFAVRVNQAGHQVWVGGALRKPGTPIGKRTKKTAFYGSHFSWLDDAADWQAARAAWSACPPDLIVCTGQVPEWRGQALWLFREPITDPARLEDLNRGIRHHLGGEDVVNADRLVRLAGTVNWPFKPGRTVPELVTLSWTNGSGSATDLEAAQRAYVASASRPATPGAAPVSGPRNVFGQVELDRAIAAARKPGRWHTVVRDAVAHLVGRKAPDDMIHLICRHFTQPGYTHEQTRADVEKLLAGARAKYGEETFDQVDPSRGKVEAPLPLRRETPPSPMFPVDALGPVLGDAARGIQAISQTPMAMCAQSVLAAAALVAQSYVDVALPAPLAQVKPVSLFFVSVGSSGERKSTCDKEALEPIRQREIELRTAFDAQLPEWRNKHDAWKADREKILRGKGGPIQRLAELSALGPVPERPLDPVMFDGQPTVEGLVKLLMRGQPSVGIFSTEGGEFVGSYSMAQEHRLKTAAQLSLFWDGAVFKRIRAAEDTTILVGRRVSLHLMCQPSILGAIINDGVLIDQGVLSRVLLSAPDSTIGTRFARAVPPEHDVAVKHYQHHLEALLREPLPLEPGRANELTPRALAMDADATRLWFEFSDEIEREMGISGRFESVRGLINKLAENAARIAAVLAFIDQNRVGVIGAEFMEAGVEIARYYASEALRLSGGAESNPDLLLAESALQWLKARPAGPVSLRDVYTYGPRPIRNARLASQVMSLLEEHGHVRSIPEGAEVNGTYSKVVWTVMP